MNTIIVWDTETTSLPIWKEPSDHPDQPHIVQLACAVVDVESRKTLASINLIAKPEGWNIPEEVVQIHGISTEYANAVGVPERDIVALFLALGAGRTHVAHNSSFDERIMRIALKRYFGDEQADEFKTRTFECTCWKSRPILKLAGNKLPKLTEAYQHFLGVPMQGAHTAMGDVDGCLAVYWAIQDILNPPTAKAPELQAA